jgi:ribonuclease E
VVPLVATTAVEVALYILNQKRAHLKDIEARYRIPITVTADEDMHISQFVIERAAEGEIASGLGSVVHMDWAHHPEAAPSAPAAAPATAEAESEPGRHRSRRRRRRGRRPEGGIAEARQQRPPHFEAGEPEAEREERIGEEAAEETKAAEAKEEGGAQVRKGPRRRGRRGGRRGRSGQRPQRGPGEEAAASAEGDGRQNGAGRKPLPEEAPAKEVAKPPHHEAERVFATATTVSEQPASSGEIRVEGPAEPEAPRRKGWWQR